MKYEIKVDEDEAFKVIPFGEQFAASDGERVEIAPTPQKASEQFQEVVQLKPILEEYHTTAVLMEAQEPWVILEEYKPEQIHPPDKGKLPRAVSLENPVDSSHHLFVGTSWSTKR